jgi:hypothetical protein
MKRVLFTLAAVALLTPMAHAVPILQLYIEGSTYDAGSETWVLDPADGPFRLWVIGNVDGEGGKGLIEAVRLSVAYDIADAPTIILTPGSTGGYGGFTDPSIAGAAAYLQTVADGSSPILSDGGSLPDHGIFGAGTAWQEFALGDFALTDSPIGDFISSFPLPGGGNEGQINVYEVSVSGTDLVHFDAYDHYYDNRGDAVAKFAPFSHDGEGGDNPPVPEPGTLAMLGLGLSGVAYKLRRKKA